MKYCTKSTSVIGLGGNWVEISASERSIGRMNTNPHRIEIMVKPSALGAEAMLCAAFYWQGYGYFSQEPSRP